MWKIYGPLRWLPEPGGLWLIGDSGKRIVLRVYENRLDDCPAGAIVLSVFGSWLCIFVHIMYPITKTIRQVSGR